MTYLTLLSNLKYLIGKLEILNTIEESNDLINEYEAQFETGDDLLPIKQKLNRLETAVYDLENYLLATYDDEDLRLDNLSDDDTADKHE
jgi:hypothetical protein